MGRLFAILLIFGTVACEKPNPTPEVADGIYRDLMNQADLAGKSAESEKKKLEGLKKELQAAKPQTGDLRIAQKQYFESERKVQQYLQQRAYYTLRAKSRKAEVRTSYTSAFAEKKPFDTADQLKDYDRNQELAKNPGSWDSKRRIANYTKETGLGGPSGAPKTEKPEKPASKGH